MIEVSNYELLKEIIAKASDEFEEEENEKERMDTTKVTLPRDLRLRFLPKLKTICSSSSKVIGCDSLKNIVIE